MRIAVGRKEARKDGTFNTHRQVRRAALTGNVVSRMQGTRFFTKKLILGLPSAGVEFSWSSFRT